MRRMAILLFGLGFLMVGVVSAEAITFTNTYDFSGETKNGRDALQIGDNSSYFTFSFTHNVLFSPPADSITSAKIVLSHLDNSNTSGEMWFLDGDTSTQIGILAASNGSWNDQTFTLPSSLFSSISGGSWALELILRESTGGNDRLWIDKSVLSGEYNPVTDPPPNPNVNAVPEPSTVILLGAGMVAIAGLRARKKARG